LICVDVDFLPAEALAKVGDLTSRAKVFEKASRFAALSKHFFQKKVLGRITLLRKGFGG